MADYIFYPAIALTGGTDDALDGYDGDELNDKDVAIVVTATAFYHYILDDDSGAAESSPDVIKPDDNAGTKRWILVSVTASDTHTHDGRYFTETEITTWRNSVTQTEMGYVNGVTSDIQTQINALIGAAGVTYENLAANGDIGTGAAQVSQGDHAHDDQYYTETELDAGQLDNRYFRENEALDASAGAGDAGKPVKLDAGGKIDTTMIERSDLEDVFYTETELDAGQLDNRYFRENEALNASAGAGDAGKPIKLDAGGKIDTTMIERSDLEDAFYTEIELDAGQLDNRYFREDEALNASAGAGDAGKPVKLDAGGKIDTTMIERSDLEDTFYTETEDNTYRNGVTQEEMGHLHGVTSDIQTQLGTKLENIVTDTTPQLGGDLDLNGKNLDFPTTPNISDVLDEDSLVSDSATKLATQQSIKAYVDSMAGTSSGCRVYRSAVQSIPDSAFTKVEFNAEDYDNQSEFDSTVEHEFTAKIAGVYMVASTVTLDDLADAKTMLIALFVNDSVYAYGTSYALGSITDAKSTIAMPVKLAVGDIVDIRVFHNNGSARNALDGAAFSYVAIQKMTAASEHGSAHENSSYVQLVDNKVAGTQGGTATSGTWETRSLKNKLHDPDSVCSFDSGNNQITLDAGTYEFDISCPAYKVGSHSARLRNITTGVTLQQGTVAYSDTAGTYAQTRSFIKGRFTIAASQVLEIQHRVGTTNATNGYGKAGTIGTYDTYTVAEFWKISETGLDTGSGFSSRVDMNLTSDQTGVTTATWTKVELDTASYDGLGEADVTTNHRFTANSAGYYMVTGNLKFNGVLDDTILSLAIYKNGAAAIDISYPVWGGTIRYNVSKLIYLDAGDYLELWGRHYIGVDGTFGGTAVYSHMTIHRLS